MIGWAYPGQVYPAGVPWTEPPSDGLEMIHLSGVVGTQSTLLAITGTQATLLDVTATQSTLINVEEL